MYKRYHTFLFCFLFALSALFAGPRAAAQEVETVVSNLRSIYEKQLKEIDNYIVETESYKSYFKKVKKDGKWTFRSATEMKNDQSGLLDTTSRASTSPYGINLDGLQKNAKHAGTETIDGQKADVLIVDKPHEVIEYGGDQKKSLKQITYYIDREKHVPVRMVMVSRAMKNQKNPTKITVDLNKYKIVNGLQYPHQTRISVDFGMSEKRLKEMKRMIKRVEQMPKKRQKQMKKMMGGNFDKLKRMVSNKPVTINVRKILVNTDLPEDVFSDE